MRRSILISCLAALVGGIGGSAALPDGQHNPPTAVISWGGAGTAPGGLDNPTDLAFDEQGNIYVVDSGNRRVQKFDPAGHYLNHWGSFGSGAGRFYRPIGIAVGAYGAVYVTDMQLHRVQKFDSDGAYLLSWGELGEDQGEMRSPAGIAVDQFDFVYVADSGNHRIQKFDADGNCVGAWGTYGTADGELMFPLAVAAGPDGIIVADSMNKRLQRFSSTGAWIETLSAPRGGVGFLMPAGLELNEDGGFFVVDMHENAVHQLDRSGNLVVSWGEGGSGLGEFAQPRGIIADGDRYIYVADTENDRVQKFSTGPVLTVQTDEPDIAVVHQYEELDPTVGLEVKDPDAARYERSWSLRCEAQGEVAAPIAVATDSLGGVYVIDEANSTVEVFDATGEPVDCWGEPGDALGQLSGPLDLATSRGGEVYVADTGNHRVQRFDRSGRLLGYWGSSGSGPGQFLGPESIAVDLGGNVYVADVGNHRIQVFNGSGDFVREWSSWDRDGVTETFGIEQLRVATALLPFGAEAYVADTDASRVYRFAAGGRLLHAWEGYGGGEEFVGPVPVAVYGTSMLLVMDRADRTIHVFAKDGAELGSFLRREFQAGIVIDPVAMAVGHDGEVYLADRGARRIHKFRLREGP